MPKSIQTRSNSVTLHVRVEIKRNVRARAPISGHARALVSLARAREKLMQFAQAASTVLRKTMHIQTISLQLSRDCQADT